MAWIRLIAETDAEGELADLYRRVAEPDGSVDNVMKVHSANPESLRTHFELYVAAMRKPSPLSRTEREIVGVVVSRINGCAYCVAHHTSNLARCLRGDRPDLPDALAAGDHDGLTPREHALAGYAARLTERPAATARPHLDALRDHDLDDRAILDLAQVIGYFNYANRIVLGLGVELEADR